MGVIYAVAYNVYDNGDDAIKVEETIKTIPTR
jgi:hypothetical protein